jgi:glucokinase
MARGVPYSIGVDLGGTNLRAAAISARGRLLEKRSGTTNLGAGREAVIGDIVAAIGDLESRHGSAALAGVGVAVPGFIRIKEGVIAGSHNLPQFNGFPVRDEIGRRLGKPVILENDANAAALGEKWRGAGRGVDDLVLLTLGTGIGGGIISGGRVLHGYLGMAAELGHITVAVNGNPCGCGNTGCLEKHASASALAAMAGLLRLGENLTAEQVFYIARGRGDAAERARRAFEAMGAALGIALASLINIFNFPLYLLSGGALPAWRFFAPRMFAEVERRSFTFRNSETRIERARLGGEAGLYGAAALPFAGAGV